MGLANSALSILSRDMLLFVSNLVTAITVARYLGPDVFGIWVAINLFPTYVDMLLRSKADSAAIYLLGIKKHTKGDITLALHLLALISSLLAFLPFLVYFDELSFFILKNAQEEYSSHISLIFLVIPLNFVYLNYMYLHTFHEDVKRVNFMILSRFLLSSFITIVSLLVFDLGLYGLIVAALAGLVVSVLVGALTFKHERVYGPLINIVLIKDLISYAYKIYISGLILNLNSYIAQIFVVSYASPANLAFYSISQQFCMLLNKIMESLGLFLFPRISKGAHQENIDLTSKAFRVGSIIMVAAFCLSCLFIYPAVHVLYGKGYLPVVIPFLIMLPGVILASVCGVFSQYFHGIGRAEIGAWIAAIPFLLQLALSFLIIPSYGINGAALVLSIGLTVSATLHLICFKFLTKLSFKKILFISYEDLKIITDFLSSIRKKVLLKSLTHTSK